VNVEDRIASLEEIFRPARMRDEYFAAERLYLVRPALRELRLRRGVGPQVRGRGLEGRYDQSPERSCCLSPAGPLLRWLVDSFEEGKTSTDIMVGGWVYCGRRRSKRPGIKLVCERALRQPRGSSPPLGWRASMRLESDTVISLLATCLFSQLRTARSGRQPGPISPVGRGPPSPTRGQQTERWRDFRLLLPPNDDRGLVSAQHRVLLQTHHQPGRGPRSAKAQEAGLRQQDPGPKGRWIGLFEGQWAGGLARFKKRVSPADAGPRARISTHARCAGTTERA